MTLVRTTRLAGVIKLAGRGPVLIEPDGTRWRLAGEVKADDVVGRR